MRVNERDREDEHMYIPREAHRHTYTDAHINAGKTACCYKRKCTHIEKGEMSPYLLTHITDMHLETDTHIKR